MKYTLAHCLATAVPLSIIALWMYGTGNGAWNLLIAILVYCLIYRPTSEAARLYQQGTITGRKDLAKFLRSFYSSIF